MSLIRVLFIALAVLSSQNSSIKEENGVDVTDLGALGDGKTDDSEAFQKAWRAVCHGNSDDKRQPTASSVFLIPRGGKYVLSPTSFEGPCAHSVTMKVQGYVIASGLDSLDGEKKGTARRWITFRDVHNLTLEGSGAFTGDGEHEEDDDKELKHDKKLQYCDDDKKENYHHDDDEKEKLNQDNDEKEGLHDGDEHQQCNGHRSTNLAFLGCSNVRVTNITSIDSPKNHISISGCEDVVISHIHLKSPRTSANTDGIDITHSTGVTIKDSHIETGDDCIEINTGTSHVNISNVECGPGHGISIGSFMGKEANVEKVLVRNCTFTGTTNGARIKTYKDGVMGGYVRSITFQNITLDKVRRPIIINQEYTAKAGIKGKMEGADAVKITDVKFIGFKGTCVGDDAITLNCGDPGCIGIVLRDVNIKGASGQSVRAVCKNARVSAESTSPKVRCLSDGGDGGGDDDNDHGGDHDGGVHII